MKAFRFVRPRDAAEAAAALAEAKDALVHAGGVDLLDRMKERVDAPGTLVSLVDAKGLDGIRIDPDGAIVVGARATLAEIHEAEACRRFLPSLAEACGQAASPQLRHRATLGGNLAQHTRCGYYRHASFPCRKRGDDACPVREEGGVQDTAGIFGNEVCASAHPSSVAPVLGSLGAEVHVRGAKGVRAVPFEAFWVKPAQGRATDTALAHGEVVEAVRIPPRDVKQHAGHAEIRQKQAFDWALVSCALRYEMEGGKVREASVWFGSLAPTPLRAKKAEAVLRGRAPDDAAAAAAAEAFLADATPLPGTAYKVKLAKVALKRALAAAREGA